MFEIFETYLFAEKRYSEHTVAAYMLDVQSMFQFAQLEAFTDLHEVSHHTVRAWIVGLVEMNLSNRSINRKLSSLRTFFKWAKREGYIEFDPMARVKGPKQEKRLPQFVKEDDLNSDRISELFSSDFFGLRDQLMIELFYQTGIRLSELVCLRENDVFNHSIKVLGKRNKERIIPVSKELNLLVQKYLEVKSQEDFHTSYLVVTDKGNKLYPKFVYRKINYYLSLVTKLSKKSPHILRHTFATHMLNNGAGLESLKEILGHANLSATQVYTHNSFDKLTSIYKQAHPRGHKKE